MSDRVHFRKIGEEGDVIALFPDLEESRGPGGRYIMSYMHVGQHSGACASLIAELEPAEPDEYKALAAELSGHPYHYRLEIVE